MRQPSDNLIDLLLKQKLCTRRDVERCEPCVRRLCRDLPDFDSVWLDALVQNHVLTSWQADRVQDSEPLLIGDLVLQNQIGGHTFLASHPGERSAVVLEELPANTFLPGTDSLSLIEIVERLNSRDIDVPASLNIPTQVIGNASTSAMLSSPHVSGWSASELVLRGGRMPWQVVAEIGQQLLSAVDWLNQEGLYHGDITSRNVRLRADGRMVLVSPFVRRMRVPVVSFSATLQLRDVETLAPELVGNGQFPDVRSELYSVGCLLWQLLAARPPILIADAVNKVSKSQAIDIPDVRTVVPDCPEWMARSLMSMTRRSPELRPNQSADVLKDWTSKVQTGHRRCRHLLRQMPDRNTELRRVEPVSTIQKIAPVSVLALLLITFTGWGIHRGLVPNPLMMKASPAKEAVSDAVAAMPQPFDAPEGPVALPEPDAAGVILLQSGATYLARSLDYSGDLYLEATSAECAIVLVDDTEPWRLSARQVAMSGVQIERKNPADSATESSAVVSFDCDVLSVSKSILSGVNWQSQIGDSSVLTLTDCIVAGDGYGLRLAAPPGRLALNNVLFSTALSAIRCDVADRRSRLAMTLDRVTQRGGAAFLDLVASNPDATDVHCEIVSGESVLTPETALVRAAGPNGWSRDRVRVDFLLPERGNPMIVPPAVEPVVALDRTLKSLVALNEGQVVADSLLMAEPQFARNDGLVEGSVLLDYEGPKLSSVLPGVLIDRLPKLVTEDHQKLTSTQVEGLER